MYTVTLKHGFGNTHGQWRIQGGGSLCETIERTDVIFVTILGLFLAPFRDKIAAASVQMLFWPENALKSVCGRGPKIMPATEFHD